MSGRFSYGTPAAASLGSRSESPRTADRDAPEAASPSPSIRADARRLGQGPAEGAARDSIDREGASQVPWSLGFVWVLVLGIWSLRPRHPRHSFLHQRADLLEPRMVRAADPFEDASFGRGDDGAGLFEAAQGHVVID